MARRTFGLIQSNCCCVLDPMGFYVPKNVTHKASTVFRSMNIKIWVIYFGLHGAFE